MFFYPGSCRQISTFKIHCIALPQVLTGRALENPQLELGNDCQYMIKNI